MVKKKITVDLRVGDELLVVEQVPATVCEHCGERVFAPAVARKFQALGKQRSKAPRTLKVPVFSMDEVSP
jgi:YgiT-type zinc finger domain-containing protein